MQAVGALYDVAHLVAKNAHALAPRSSLHLADHLALKAHQARMREIKREGDAGRVVRAEPFVGEPSVRAGDDAPALKLAMKVVHHPFKPRVFVGNAQIAKPEL